MKKSINKLSLNKMTISNLYAAEMNQMVGGVKGSKTVICMPPLTKNCPSTAPATCSACNCTVVK
ncbi:MAG: class I lanthipeptide [Bacteroidetes bacterium]|nr:class I lanthipeptide [Bacteroidota bacterium]